MIDQQVAAIQVDRLSGLDRFPVSRAAQREMMIAFQTSSSAEMAKAIADEWISANSIAPKPADIRRLIWEASTRIREKRKSCTMCEGSGSITAFFLVTYEGQSPRIAKSERLGSDYTHARQVLNHIAAAPQSVRQNVISAAEACSCVKHVTVAHV